MTKNSFGLRSASAAAIIGLTLTLGAPAAFAQDATPTAAATVNKANIDFTRTGSLTLYKKQGAESGTRATGSEMTGVPGAPLKGVEFTVKKVDFDLATGDWTKIPATAADAKTFDSGFAPEALTTNTEGKVKFENLPIGIYLVEETKAPNSIVKGAPFIVSIPMTNDKKDAWNYDVVAYPKNAQSIVKKEVNDADANIQDAYSYTITADAPQFDDPSKEGYNPTTAKKLTNFIFSDKLDPRLIDPKVTEVKAGDLTLGSTDYTVSDAGANPFTVTLTDKGLAKVKPGVKMSLTFTVKRKEVGKTIDLTNEAEVIFNNPNTGDEVKQETNSVVTYHGKLKVVKKDENERTKVLEGAEFELYRCEAGATKVETANKIAINGVSTWATGADGTFTIDGLHVTDVEDHDKSITKNYCLVETKAPAGYSLNKKPISFTMTREDIAQTGEGDDAITLVKDIVNVKESTPQLPLTGGTGIGILAAIGAALVGAGAWFARRNSKKA